jgi:hypothetical protein
LLILSHSISPIRPDEIMAIMDAFELPSVGRKKA